MSEDADAVVVTSYGEIIELPEPVAAWFRSSKEEQEIHRIQYCAKYHKDPETFTGCPGCGNTGINYSSDLPCYCKYSIPHLKRIHDAEDRETARLAELVRHGRTT